VFNQVRIIIAGKSGNLAVDYSEMDVFDQKGAGLEGEAFSEDSTSYLIGEDFWDVLLATDSTTVRAEAGISCHPQPTRKQIHWLCQPATRLQVKDVPNMHMSEVAAAVEAQAEANEFIHRATPKSRHLRPPSRTLYTKGNIFYLISYSKSEIWSQCKT